MRSVTPHHSVPILAASLDLYEPPIRLRGFREEYVACILSAGILFLPEWL